MEACAAEPLLGDAERRIMQMGEMERDVVGGAPLRSRLGWSRALLLVPPLLLVGFVTTLLLSSQGVPPPPQHPSHSPHEPSFEVPSFVYRPKYACAICADIVSAEPLLNAGEHACSVFGACESINASTRSCREFCPDLAEQATMPSPVDIAPTLGLRVSKALGSKPYKLLRVSVVTRDDRDTSTPLLGAKRFDYSAPFRFRWTENSLHSSLVRVVPGETTTLDVGGVPVRLSLPHSGEGAAGIMIADTCVSYASLTALVTCTYGVKYELARRLPALLDAFMSGGNASSDPSSELSFWGMLGDNLYDRTGEVSSSFFDSLSLAVKSKPLLTVLGNHDYWILGTPRAATKWDQFGNGFMQFYAQDSYAASELQPGSPEAPFDFSSDPDHGRAHNNPFGGQKVSLPNTFFFNQIGNSGFIGFSGAYPIVETLPLLRDACAALAQTPGVDIVWLLGHWDMENLGCKAHMVFTLISSMMYLYLYYLC
mmetsp:Transcript_8866/g.20713  ORF Transcript_8866/g.20713 Transcript_8866/m.20713 type:complete len:482 (+) Transcript_8866:133-1578(+)